MLDQAVWEVSIELMSAMMQNPNVNIGDTNLAVIAVNHAERLVNELESRMNQGLN